MADDEKQSKGKNKGKPLWEPNVIRGSIGSGAGETAYSGYSTREQEIRKTEGKIVAEMMNGMNIDFTNATWYSPELTPDMWLMPKSRLEVLRWVRLFYSLDPYIYSIINMHAMYPFSNFDIVAQDSDVSKFYKQCAFNRNFNVLDHMLQMSLSENKFGEAINMGVPEQIDHKMKNGSISKFKKWRKMILFEPEFIEVRQAFFEDRPRYYMQVTNEMKKDIREAMREGVEVENAEDMLTKKEIQLPNEQMSAIMNLTDASANRGTSPIQALLRVLLYQDKVSMLKLAAIDRFRYPIEIWKIGDLANNIKPTQQQLKEFEAFIKQAKDNPPFSIFVPPFVNYEVVGYGPEKANFDYTQDYEWIRDSIMVGLGVNKTVILGEGPSMSNVKDLSLTKLFMIYKVKQDRYTNWLQNEFFYPIAAWNKFYTEDGDLDVPQIHWSKPINVDRDETDDYMKLWEAGVLSTRTLIATRYKGVDLDNEEKNLKDELNTIFDDGARIKNRNIKPAPPEGDKTGKGAEATPTPEAKPEEKPAGEAPAPEAKPEETPAAPEAAPAPIEKIE